MENNRFEDSFRNAFSEAELSPSAAVWTNVELELEKATGGKMKRNLLLFQLLAAASVAFACGVGALYYLDQPVNHSPVNSQALNTQEIPKSAKSDKAESFKNSSNGNQSSEEVQNDTNENATVKAKQLVYPTNKLNHQTNNVSVPPVGESKFSTEWVAYKINRNELSSLVKTKRLVLVLPEPERVEADPEMLLQAQLRDIEKKYQDEDKKRTKSTENAWASVGFGAGSYKPNRELVSKGLPSGSNKGESYSVAMNVGGKISKRLIVQGGISYLTQNADFTSTSSNGSVASLYEYSRPYSLESPGTSNGGPDSYQVNSSLQFVSIPVQAGYLIVDRAFGIQLNGGISTDLFISNTLTPESNYYQKVTQTAGKDSPFRTVNFSGLVGTEFSYKIADQYRISVNPGLRYSLNSIYKEGVAAEITPVTFDVSLRFRYIFK